MLNDPRESMTTKILFTPYELLQHTGVKNEIVTWTGELLLLL